jgi:hypothetical protein
VSKTSEKPKKYEERLMATFAFDEDDLEANQAGYFSAQQRDRFQAKHIKGVWTAAFFSLLVAGVLGGILVGIPTPSPIQIILTVGILMFGGLLSFFALQIRRLRADLQEDRVLTAEGRIDLSLKTGQNKADYFLRVAGMRFPIKKRAFLAFKNGDPYRIYYAPHSKRILSVEWLRDNDDNLIDETEVNQADDGLATDVGIERQEKARRS